MRIGILFAAVVLAACSQPPASGSTASSTAGASTTSGTSTGSTGTSSSSGAGSTSSSTASTGSSVGSTSSSSSSSTGSSGSTTGSARGFPATAPWVSFYGTDAQMGDLGQVASTFRVINIDVDPGGGNFTTSEVQTLRDGGQNRVISYLNVGACENYRDYWASAPAGFVSCSANTAAQRGAYQGYPDETWMDVGNADYQHLIVDYVAPRLAAQGVDGFFLDNLEIVEHGTQTTNGPCDAACAQGGLDLVKRLRDRFPDLLIVMQNATGDTTRLGVTGGVSFPSLLDGISHEEVYQPSYDASAEQELLGWEALGLRPGGRAFFIGTEDYVGSCTNTADAQSAYQRSRANGFSPYATDASGSQTGVCYWPF